jgi:hypothetical protein
MTNLSPHAKSSLERVSKADNAYRSARDKFEQQLLTELDIKLESYVAERNTAVKLADLAGVPRTQIGRALGTTNYRTVQDILEQAGETVKSVESQGEDNWTVIETSYGWELTVNNLGAGAISGTAVVASVDGDLMYVEGDAFVVPQVYRNGIAEDIIKAIG